MLVYYTFRCDLVRIEVSYYTIKSDMYLYG